MKLHKIGRWWVNIEQIKWISDFGEAPGWCIHMGDGDNDIEVRKGSRAEGDLFEAIGIELR